MTSSNARSRAISAYTVKLLCGTALAGGAMLAASAAYAQNENVTVTGTSIRGAQPVGAAIISVDRATIEETAAVTTSELLTNIPQITGAAGGFGSSGQRNEGGGGAIASPNIHSLGTQASTATLVLIDGHVFAPVGQTTNVVDPSIIPTAALQRVEVLPDGASAIYGANAVAGVINFITRRDFSGWETRVQAGVADHYTSFSASQLFGHTWEGGSVMAVYGYSSRSNLYSKHRDFQTSRQDIRMGQLSDANAKALYTGLNTIPTTATSNVGALYPANGSAVSLVGASVAVAGADRYRGMTIPYASLGSNSMNFNCPVAAISTGTNTNAFLYPYGAGGVNSVPVYSTNLATGVTSIVNQSGFSRTVSNGSAQGVCDQEDYSTELISSNQNNILVAIRQQINDRISVNVDLVRGSHLTTSRSSRGNLSAIAFNPDGTGGPAFGTNQRNPFWVDVPGAPANATSQFITFNFDELLGPGAFSKQNTTNQFAAMGIDVDLGGDWLLSVSSTLGASATGSRTFGTVSAAQAALALNGSINTSGSLLNLPADPYVLGNVVTVSRSLTMANALDVWAPKALNRTSASTLRSLTDSATNTVVYNNVQDVNIKVDGPLGDFWGAGQIKAAFGANYNHLTQPQAQSNLNGAGPGSTSSRGTQFAFARTSYAAYAEFLIPVVNEDMGIPLVRTFTLDVSGRFDTFSDFGQTKNPKVSFTWGILDGLSGRGAFSTSFVAPNVHDVGGPAGVNSQTAVSNTQITNGRIFAFRSVNPLPYSQGPFGAVRGIGTVGTFVETPTSCLALNSVTGLSASGAALVDIAGTVIPSTGTTVPVGLVTGTGVGQAYGCRLTTGNSNSQFTGLQLGGANATLRPERGLTYSAGFDFDAGRLWDVLEGFRGAITYYNTKFIDVVTNQQVQVNIPEATSFGPACGTGSTSTVFGTAGCLAPGWAVTDPFIQDLIATRPVNGALPNRVYTIVDNRIQNPFVIWQAGIDFELSYRVETDDFGAFTLTANGNQIIRFSQKPSSVTGVVSDVNNCKNGARYCSSEFSGSMRLAWRMDAFSASTTFNFTHAYNAPNNTFPYSLPGPNRVAGFQHVGSLQTLDMNFGYTLPEEWLEGTSLSLTINNVLDKTPPFFNNTAGFTNGSQIGRLISFGVVKKW